MGFEQKYSTAPAPAEPLWRHYRDQFPVTERLIYLNHAAVTPLPRASAEAMQWLAQDALDYGSLHYDQWLDTYERLRVAAARLIGAERSEIAIVKNTSEGIATVAMGLNWHPGDRVVAFREEFPSNYYPWLRLEEHRASVDWLSVTDPLDVIDRACQGAKLLAISFVQYLSGLRADLNTIGEICRRHNCFFLVDAIQGLGAFPLNVQAAHIDALAADGHKWMLGPEGCGILYVRKSRQDSVFPMEFGWTNVAGYHDYSSRDMTLRPDAGRYECGTLNTIGCYGLRASLEFLLEVGIERIAPAVQALTDQLAEGAVRKGYQLLGDRTPENGAGIVALHKPGMDSRQVVHELKERGIIAAPRQGWVRFSPHFYISPDDIERVVETLP
ncbi:MAG TPA: aminotransferase class V-fold PLP-dependent enzyme [Bryobacteraceae bacterium]|jgi:selenocysteine lyase/cysteine desulfurase|nr:aminotransferase class V-fold PLP-dependent enzyme [Bryobacteraceae bacterium]